MKKVLLLAIAIVNITLVSWSQNLESIKTAAMLGQYEKAKADLDKVASNPKIMGKAEAYALKATIYGALSMSDSNRNKSIGNNLAEEADIAFEKYKQMEPDMKKLDDEAFYQNGPKNIYYSYFGQGYQLYEEKRWNDAIPKLQKAISYSDFLINKNWVQFPLDTNLLELTGVVAELGKDNAFAASIYGRLADARVTAANYEKVYQFLVRYYFINNDIEKFEKIKLLGSELYPKSEFFQYDELDFAAGLAESFDKKLQAIGGYIAKDPDNYKAHELRWTTLYDTIMGIQEGDEIPANFKQMESDLITSIKKCGQLKPQEVRNHLFLGNYFVNKKEVASQARTKHEEEVQTRTKPGTKASPADITKREQLYKDYLQALDMIYDPYVEAAKIYGASQDKLDAREKQQFKIVTGYLSEICESKKKRSSKDPATAAKWAAEEKKWNEVYESIK